MWRARQVRYDAAGTVGQCDRRRVIDFVGSLSSRGSGDLGASRSRHAVDTVPENEAEVAPAQAALTTAWGPQRTARSADASSGNEAITVPRLVVSSSS